MTLILTCLIIGLTILNTIQFRIKKQRDAQLAYLSKKLHQITEESSSEQLLLATDDPYLRALLVEINQLMDYSQRIEAQFTRTERSIKKMLSNISHDLKTPLTVVLGYIETIQHDPGIVQKEKEKILLNIHEKTSEIIKLMNSFFDLAKLESGDKEIPLTKVHINEVCKRNLLLFYDWIQGKGIEMVIQIPDHPIYALGNEEALDRILTNLLSNAIRYGGDGKVIGLSLRYNDKQLFIDVWDRGKGINEREQEHIFERLYTLEESRNKFFQGSGLGLTITKRLVEKLRGKISLQSTPYHRTTFTIQLKRISD
ncbi:HAMP domain-containing histidine kinase [Kroppenstedtia pulmonis]|uniref:histidine kinase n=1 Tax=Kroppenstedtia pulmonis TaxID=1380685 RepID=A0A7D3Y9G3_9BACL|nr:sensor histidine kinase [Kroppenstedtia pulmonis]QKG84281.1 HAMP domain-containing histidine kinase [Kroppenstedtia pulmonis]